MKVLASYLAVILAAAPAHPAPAPEPAVEESAGVDVDTLTVTAPRVRPDAAAQNLKTARAAGVGTAAVGAGWIGYVVLAGTGPFGWAAALVFLGGMSAYLAHRRLAGEDDFGPARPRPAPAGRSPQRTPAGSSR